MNDDDFDAKEVGAEHLSVACRKRIRDELQAEVEAFLARGGQIQQIDGRVRVDPPQRPVSHYSSRSI